jgi:mono/diheme cytochrome c family protein
MKSAVGLTLFCILVFTAACSGLSNEPQIVATLEPSPAQLGQPAAPPDIANGARIYASRCISCHGINGEGNGELVTSGQLNIDGEVVQPANFRDPAVARDQTPQEWFATITNGRIERLMPPWANALTEQERWDVAYYTYTLHYTQDQLTRGREIWEIECVDCHGVEGRGDGPEANNQREQTENLTDLREMAIVSDNVLFNFINEGSADSMPAFGEEYTEDQIWDTVAFSRTFSLANTNAIGLVNQLPSPSTTEEAETTVEAAASGIVTGRITNGTAAATVPPDLPVTLFVIDQEFNSQRFETTSDTEGNFTFTDVPLGDTLSYATTVSYRERPFASEVVTGGTPNMQLPITIYELTEDPSVITVTGLVHQASAVADGLQVAQVMIFQNNSDRAFTSGRTVGENLYASVFVTLPPGASVIGFPDGQGRYIVSDDQSTIIDTVAVMPGRDHIVQVIYLLPYEGSAIIEQPINYALNGPVRLLLLPETVTAASEQLPSIGLQEVGGVSYAGYGAELTLNAGEVIRYELSGTGVSSVTQLEPQAATSTNLVVIVLIGLGGILVLVGVIFALNRRSKPVDKQQLMDALLKQIAELDEAEARGEINHDLYHHQRKQLKARLSQLMEQEE